MGSSFDFQGKAVVVTGGTTGIGEACVRGFRAAGASVWFVGRNKERADAILKSLEAFPGSSHFISGDVRDDGFPDRVVDSVVQRHGRLDVLVNNAGILIAGTAPETTDEDWDATFAVNVTAVFRFSRAAVRAMIPNKSGAIVNIASEWGLNGENGYVAYCASKGAVVQITRAMGLDHAADNVRINSVCPGEVHTQMVDEMLAEMGSTPEELARGIPMRRLAQPSEVADCVMFLASELSSYVTGSNISIDGGNDASAGAYP